NDTDLGLADLVSYLVMRHAVVYAESLCNPAAPKLCSKPVDLRNRLAYEAPPQSIAALYQDIVNRQTDFQMVLGNAAMIDQIVRSIGRVDIRTGKQFQTWKVMNNDY